MQLAIGNVCGNSLDCRMIDTLRRDGIEIQARIKIRGAWRRVRVEVDRLEERVESNLGE